MGKKLFNKKEIKTMCEQIRACISDMDDVMISSFILSLSQLFIIDTGNIEDICYTKITSALDEVEKFINYVYKMKLADITDEMLVNLLQIRSSAMSFYIHKIVVNQIEEQSKLMNTLFVPNNGEIN